MASDDEPTQTQVRAPRRRATRRASAPDAPALTGLEEMPSGSFADPSPTGGDGDRAVEPTDGKAPVAQPPVEPPAAGSEGETPPVRRARKRVTRPASPPSAQAEIGEAAPEPGRDAAPEADAASEAGTSGDRAPDEPEPAPRAASSFGLLFKPPAPAPTRPSRRRTVVADDQATDGDDDPGPGGADGSGPEATDDAGRPAEDGDGETGRRRRRRGGKGRRRPGDEASTDDTDLDRTPDDGSDQPRAAAGGGGAADAAEDDAAATGRKRTRRRRRSGSATEGQDPPGTVTKVREPRHEREEATGIRGSTRLEAKKQRRREGREAGRRRTVITEAEFLARRESVERVMVVRQRAERTQIGVLEDGVLVEHYVSTAGSGQGGANGIGTSIAGNVYLGRVQNVLPSMEAAFVDIGKGRNAVLYAGEVNWDAAGLESNRNRRIEQALSPGQGVLVQVTKDAIGHKGARLTSQVSLPGRFLVYVPNGSMTGISRKLPDTERTRLKKILREIVPEDAGVIVRTAAEGASEAELTADVERLTKIWDGIQKKAKSAGAPALLHGEVDLTVRVIRDVFNEDFASLVVAGDQAWETIGEYVESVAPDLAARLTKWTREADVFAHYRIDEQLAKAMDRKVWLPSGGSLVIDRTEAMTVVDVNTGKFVGSGGNLEETVTKNNIEAAEEIVRQLRLRDIGGIIVIDFIDMVLESNRDLVVRRLLECLGRDRTKHQVAEVTSLGLVQMTRKRVGAGLIEVFSEPCEHCGGRGLLVRDEPVERPSGAAVDSPGSPSSGGGRSGRGRRGRGGSGTSDGSGGESSTSSASGPLAADKPAPTGPTPAQIAAQAYAALHASGHAAPGSEGGTGDGADPADVVPGETTDQVEGPSGSVSGQEPEADALVEDSRSHYPAPRARRKRGRVVAPAGPPRGVGDDTDIMAEVEETGPAPDETGPAPDEGYSMSDGPAIDGAGPTQDPMADAGAGNEAVDETGNGPADEPVEPVDEAVDEPGNGPGDEPADVPADEPGDEPVEPGDEPGGYDAPGLFDAVGGGDGVPGFGEPQGHQVG